MAEETVTFNMTVSADSEIDLEQYFVQVLSDGDADEIIAALRYIAKVRGMMNQLSEIDASRDSIYCALTEGGQSNLDIFMRITRALGLNLPFA